MVRIEVGNSVYLEIVLPIDAPELFTLVEKNREHIGQFLPWVQTTQSENDILLFIKTSCDQLREMTGINYKILVQGKIVGAIGFFVNNVRTNTFEIGYWIDKEHSGSGIVSSLIAPIEQVCFKHYKARKIEIRCAINNIASNRVAQKNNYKLEGTLTNAEKIGEQYFDYNIYGKESNKLE